MLSLCSVVSCEGQIQVGKEKANPKAHVRLSFKTYLPLYFREVTTGRGQAAIVGVESAIPSE